MQFRPLFLLLILGFFMEAKAQFNVDIVLNGKPANHANDTIYLTGAFNKWAPGDEQYVLSSESNGLQKFTLKDIKPGLLEFKFTRGSWLTLESTLDGRLVAPRRATIQKDTLIQVNIEGWRDDFPASTASKQVKVLSEGFDIPQLGVKRKIWIYLPEDYEKSKEQYPVLYMHDGQDLFDEATSQGRIGPLEWGVDETIDAAKRKVIVVAVEHHEDKNMRLKEYFYHDNPEQAGVQGKAYVDFVVNTLKPFVDKNYRTKADKPNTFMAGSSMGGLITFYAGLNYPNIFGALGILSPSIWQDYAQINKEIEAKIGQSAIKSQRYFFYGGGNENRAKPDGSFVRMNDDVNKAVDQFKASEAEIKVSINPDGRHGAWYWRSAFAEFYNWLTNHK